jgi:hypothetical protein
MQNNNRKILIDADVVSHFLTASEGDVIHRVFPNNPIYILDKVHAESQNWPVKSMLQEVSQLLTTKKIQLMDFPEDDEQIKKEYFWIKKMQFKGDGESASLAVARYHKNILASSNLKDIKNYCIMHKIDYLTTMDFLCEALQSKLFTEERCNQFIQKVLDNKSRLPCKTMKEYQCRLIDFL